jgi:hypothetical protein
MNLADLSTATFDSGKPYSGKVAANRRLEPELHRLPVQRHRLVGVAGRVEREGALEGGAGAVLRQFSGELFHPDEKLVRAVLVQRIPRAQTRAVPTRRSCLPR